MIHYLNLSFINVTKWKSQGLISRGPAFAKATAWQAEGRRQMAEDPTTLKLCRAGTSTLTLRRRCFRLRQSTFAKAMVDRSYGGTGWRAGPPHKPAVAEAMARQAAGKLKIPNIKWRFPNFEATGREATFRPLKKDLPTLCLFLFS